MNKTQLVKELAERTNLTQKDISTVLDAFQSVVKDNVANGDKVSLTGFLTFDKKHVEAKTGVIQLGEKKGQTWTTPAKDEISVKISKSYKAI